MNRRILIVEDDPPAARLIEYTLQQRGFQVLTTQNGLEGIITAQKEDPALIILDVMLPGIDGFEVCRRLRAGPQTAQTPILIISAKAQQEDIATGLKMGANDYLAKPASPEDIIGRVENLLSQKTDTQSKIITFISSKAKVGTTMLITNLAIALSQMGKQVIQIDIVPNRSNTLDQVQVNPREEASNLLEINNVSNRDPGPALHVQPTGVRVLRIGESSEHDSIANVDLLFHKLGQVADFILVDMPFQPTVVTRWILLNCDLAIIISNHQIDTLAEVKHIVKLLRFLGISLEKVTSVVIDSDGTFPDMSLNNMKSYVEANVNVTLIGVVPYDANINSRSYTNSQPVILSVPDSPIAQSIKGLAQRILAQSIIKLKPRQIESKEFEWGKISGR